MALNSAITSQAWQESPLIDQRYIFSISHHALKKSSSKMTDYGRSQCLPDVSSQKMFKKKGHELILFYLALTDITL